MSAPIRSVALLGTGIMGVPIGRNLLEAGFDVRAWNRSRDKAEPLAADGATLGDGPADAVAGADAMMTMLADAGARGWRSRMGRSARRTTTRSGSRCRRWASRPPNALRRVPRRRASPTSIARCWARASRRRTASWSCSPRVPRRRSRRRRPCSRRSDARTIELGDEPGAATRLKLVLNTWVLSLTVGLAETIAVADALGVDGARFLDVIEGGPLDAGYAQMKGAMMLEREYEPSFPLRLAHKDARLVIEAVDDQDLDPLLADAVRRRFAAAEEIGHGDSDMAAAYEAASPREDVRPAAAP